VIEIGNERDNGKRVEVEDQLRIKRRNRKKLERRRMQRGN